MHTPGGALVLTMTLLFPRVSNAQAYVYPTPPPEFTSAADWQLRGDPIVVNGVLYFPTRAFRLFDAQVMVQNGVYQGVPIYADVTLEPYSIIYVPVSRFNMRVYERRRDGALAGTAGSRTPSFPVEVASPTVLANTRRATAASTGSAAGNETAAVENPAANSPSASAATRFPLPISTTGIVVDRPRSQHTRIEVIPKPVVVPANGVWLEFRGSRWYADGEAAPFSPARFEPIGDYHGFAVYRAREGTSDLIWVSVAEDGPLAPYRRQ
jgi:hypothetical protein